MRNILQIKVGLRIKDLRAVHDVSQERFANKIYYTYMLYKHNKKVTNDDKSATSGDATPTPSRSATESRDSVAGRDDPLRQSSAKAHASCLKSG